ncbi:MAG: hypothetical protein ACLUQ4_11510 [Mediterraneibacter faecis]
MGRDAFKPKHASSVSISGVIDTGVNSNYHNMKRKKAERLISEFYRIQTIVLRKEGVNERIRLSDCWSRSLWSCHGT